jgi:HK97 family phage prohead protease
MNKLLFSKGKDKIRFSGTIQFDATETANNSSTRTVSGLAIVYNTLSDDRGGYQVRIVPGSAQFTEPTLALYSHNYENILGSTANKTLVMEDTPDGIKVQIQLPDTQLGRDTYVLIRDGYMRGASFGAIPLKTAVPAFTDTNIEADPEDKPKEDKPEDVPTGYTAMLEDQVKLEQARLNFWNISPFDD